VEYSLNDTIYINKVEIREFLNTLSYPLCFLDFETVQPVIPEYQGTHPYQQIPFQYSLHYIEEIDGKLKHKEFLGISGQDPRRALAEQLCKDIPMNVCVTAYNKAFECTRLRELAETFPDLSEHPRPHHRLAGAVPVRMVLCSRYGRLFLHQERASGTLSR